LNIRGAACCIAAEGVIYTAHGGGLSFDEAMRIDCEAVQTMSGAMASHKPLIMSSDSGIYGDTGVQGPVTEDCSRILTDPDGS